MHFPVGLFASGRGRPSFRRLILPYLAYYRPGFHPADHDSRELLTTWKDRLFGAEGSLRTKARVMGRSAAA